ncbi:hypothetical protein EDB84DRAFT_524333 [Lactarius hengduanensis]|nr:hypothetical protein EDB84DRAFT_524333 [Lactarius hengduanensis]
METENDGSVGTSHRSSASSARWLAGLSFGRTFYYIAITPRRTLLSQPTHLTALISTLEYFVDLPRLSQATEDHSMTHTTPSPPPPPSKLEAYTYYAGLPSRPRLIARTGTPWEEPTGPEAYSRLRELRVVGEHEISDVWEDDLALKVHAVLHAKGVDWTSTDVVRIRYIDDDDDPSGDVVLWIGVKPDSLSYKVGIDVALQCKGLLLDYGINDVEVEIRQSEIICSATGPQLLQPAFDHFHLKPSVTAEAREPLTPSLGITICSRSTPGTEGTGGFFLSEGSGSKRLLLVTARHVVFPLDKDNDNLFERKSDSERRHDILIFSDESFKQYLVSIKDKIRGQGFEIDYQKRRIETVAGRDDEKAKEKRKDAQRELDKAEANVVTLTALHHEVSTHWATEESRILGHVIFSPPSPSVLAPSSIPKMWPSSRLTPPRLIQAAFRGTPLTLNAHNFDYPIDHRLHLRGTITDNEMRRPIMYDRNDKPCIIVLKRGKTSGLTVGCANNVFSYTRKYLGDNNTGISKEWTVLPFDAWTGGSRDFSAKDFSAKGDSGSVVVDGAGRIGGLITCGAGKTDSIDVTYVTPIGFILKTIRNNKSLARSYPKSGPSEST